MVRILTILLIVVSYVNYATSYRSKFLISRRIRGRIIARNAFIPTRTTDSTPLSSKSSFEDFTALYQRCNSLSALESDFLLGFWSDSLNCFNITPQKDVSAGGSTSQPRVSITSTCLTIQTILQNPEHWKNLASWEDLGGSTTHVALKKVIQSLYSTTWSGDAFQTPVLVQTLCKLRAVNKNDARFIEAVTQVVSQRSQLSLHRKQPNSAYLRHQNVRALLSIVENDMVPQVFVGTNQIGYALERANMVASDELSRQLAFHYSDDSANFDVIVLAYSLLAYWESSQSLFLGSFARGVVPPTNIKLVKSALQVIFGQQSSDGTWRKGEPIFKTGASRDIGNSYVFFFDLIGCLLGPLAQAQPDLLSPYLPNFERCLSWAETNILEEMLPDVCDPVTGRCKGETVRGWRSNHLDTGGAVAWCTAQVFFAVGGMKTLLKNYITKTVLAEFAGTQYHKSGGARMTSGDTAGWDNLMNTDLQLGNTQTTLKEVVLKNVLQPQFDKQISLGCAFYGECGGSALQETPRLALYSLILFGPPGTAKTTICSAMARYLGWNFVTIDTACFLKDGLEHVASRMSYIFDRLKALEKTIILFDEIEEFCLDRENTAIGMESRLLTTAMLTQLNALRSKQNNIFIVATNRLRSFDAAVTRPGRFDMLLFVGTPNMSSRIKRLTQKLDGVIWPEKEVRTRAIECFTQVLKERWAEARFLSFAENEALINFVLDLFRGASGDAAKDANADSVSAADGNRKAQLMAKVDSVLRTSTIQGSVKEEYVISEKLSRL